MKYRDFSPERQKERRERILKIKRAHPETFFPSEYHQAMFQINLLGAEMSSALDTSFPLMAILSRCCGTRNFLGQAMVHAGALGNLKYCKDVYDFRYRPSLDARDKDGNTALLNAVKRKRLGVAEWLLKRGAKILPNKLGYNPVLMACYNGCVPALNMFKHYGIDFNKGYTYWTRSKKMKLPEKVTIYPVAVACLAKKPKAVQWLIDNGASIDVPLLKNHPVRDLITSPEIDTETKNILAKKVLATPTPVKPIPFWKRLAGRN